MQKPDNSNRLTLVKEKVLALVGTFFYAPISLKINEIDELLYSGIMGRNWLRMVACFKSKSAIGNLHQNNEKNTFGNP